MCKFLESEQLGRDVFTSIFPNYTKEFSTGKYDWYDVSGYTTCNTEKLTTPQPYIAEIKVRENITHNTYPTVMLEVQKYDSLISYTLQSNIPSFYFCTYTDKTLVCNLSNLELDKIEKRNYWLPVHTKEDSGYKEKEIYEVPLSYFKVINKGYKKI